MLHVRDEAKYRNILPRFRNCLQNFRDAFGGRREIQGLPGLYLYQQVLYLYYRYYRLYLYYNISDCNCNMTQISGVRKVEPKMFQIWGLGCTKLFLVASPGLKKLPPVKVPTSQNSSMQLANATHYVHPWLMLQKGWFQDYK